MECWKFPHPEERTKVKVLNKKYCWLYPESEKKIIKKLRPKIEECKTLYTRCDYALEACVHAQTLVLEKELRDHQQLLDDEIQLQTILIDKMWVQSQRYLILTNSGICVKPYPEIVSAPTEDRILCKFHKKLKMLHHSNCRLRMSLENIKASIAELDRRCNLLDMTVESIFILGNHYQKPLAYTRNLINDMYKYFYSVICKLLSWAQLIDPGDENAIQDYMALVKPSLDYKNQLTFLTDSCTCLRINRKECITPDPTVAAKIQQRLCEQQTIYPYENELSTNSENDLSQ